MHILNFEHMIERELREIIEERYPLDWKEDVITHELARRFRNHFRRITLHGIRYPLEVEWEIYKLHGSRETAHGDIGLLIRYKLPAGTLLEGAGFLEAKLRDRNSSRFFQARPDQVNRILARSPQTRLLLYDYRPVPVLDEPFDSDFDWDFLPHPFYRKHLDRSLVTHGPVLPLQLAATINQYDDTLYRFCYSLAHQFSRRYFHLHDLDFSQPAIQTVKGFPTELGSPNIIMVIRAAVRGQELPEEWLPSGDRYRAIE
jgi:hypothetical protein